MTFLLLGALLLALSIYEIASEDRNSLPAKFMRWPGNLGLEFINLALVVALPASTTIVAAMALGDTFGISPWLRLPLWLEVPLWALAQSFVAYWLHRGLHAFPFLWAVHQVHHSDKKLDATTGLRHHPLELLLTICVMLIPLLLIAPRPETVLLVSILDQIMSMVTHSNLPLSQNLEGLLSKVLVTPKLHAYHHSSWQPETDSNYGNAFIFWDRLFGTFAGASNRHAKEFRLGLDDVSKDDAEDLFRLLVSPLQRLLK